MLMREFQFLWDKSCFHVRTEVWLVLPRLVEKFMSSIWPVTAKRRESLQKKHLDVNNRPLPQTGRHNNGSIQEEHETARSFKNRKMNSRWDVSETFEGANYFMRPHVIMLHYLADYWMDILKSSIVAMHIDLITAVSVAPLRWCYSCKIYEDVLSYFISTKKCQQK